MTTLPTTLATIATSLITSLTSASQNADLNNDGVVDSTDLVLLATNIGACEGECQSDINNDGVTDSSDIIGLMKLWGPVPNYVAQDDSQDQSTDTTHTRDPNRDMSWQGQAPVLLDAIYYDQYTEFFSHGGPWRWNTAQEYNQGEFAMAWANENSVEVQPMVYGAVDWDHDGNLSEEDKANFVIWLDETLPADYSGPLCLDLEGQWWGMLDTNNQTVMDLVIDTYIEQLEYAQQLRPNAKIGFWGFPKKSHTTTNSSTASVQRLVDACTAIFPDVYEHNPGHNDAVRLQRHLERTIEMAKGEIPVYAQTFPRYKDQNSTSRDFFHTKEEFLRDQVQASLDAVWTDANGKEHRVNGIAFWEAYTYVTMYTDGWSEMTMDERKEKWNEIDHLHVELLTGMKELVDAAASTLNVQIASSEKEAVNTQPLVAATPKASTVKKQARLTRVVRNTTPAVTFVKSSSRSAASTYRSARKSWSQARRAFSSARRNYRKGSQQYNRAYAAYKQAREEMQFASQEYRQTRSSNRTARATLNQAKEQMKSASANSSGTTLLASK
ncbi:MAG: hypothetical protein ISR75_00140 [Phycisphaerales bacterium]|nr:hypothetical protein [Planctomycetota bacterium]MBL6996832.1 hypothetical protein [Phycisphaerales bacterium]